MLSIELNFFVRLLRDISVSLDLYSKLFFQSKASKDLCLSGNQAGKYNAQLTIPRQVTFWIGEHS